MKVYDFLKELAEKAGVDKKIFETLEDAPVHELKQIELPTDISNGINKSLLSLKDAKNNHPEIKSHYFGEIMSNVDRSLERVYSDLELEKDVIDELNKETSSTKRIALLGEKLGNVIETKVTAAGKKPSETVASLNTTINELNEKLRVEKEGRNKDSATHKEEMNKFQKNIALSSKTSGLKTKYDDLPSEVRSVTIDTLLNKELQDSNAEFVLDNGSLKLQKKDGSNFFDENNRQLGVDDFINKTLAKHKVLKQSDAPAEGEQPGGNPTNGQPPIVVSGQSKKINMGGLIEESLQGLNGSTAPMI